MTGFSYARWLSTPSPPARRGTRYAAACTYGQCGYVVIRPTQVEADTALTAHHTDRHTRTRRG